MQLWTKAFYNPFQIILSIGFLFGFFLPISTKISNVLLIAFMVGVAGLVFKGKMRFNNKTVTTLKYSTLVLIVPCILSILYHGDFLTAINVIGKRISYVLIPLSFLFFLPKQLLSLKKYALRGIVYGGILSSLVLLLKNLLIYYATRPLFTVDNEIFNFYYTGFNFTALIDIHPSYFGMYLLLSTSALLFGKLGIPKVLRLFSVVFFFFIILFLSSRVILFFYFVILLVYILNSFLKLYGKSKLALLSFSSVVLILFLSTYILIKETYIYTSLTEETLWELTFNVNDKYNSKTLGDSRVARWDVAIDLIKNHPLIGYGVGNEKNILEEGFLKEGMNISARNKYDSHNLFLGYAIETGVLSMLILLYYLFTNLFFFIKYKNAMFILFLFSVIGMCLIENYLNNNAAITFLAFFGNLFLFEAYFLKANTKDELF